MPETLYDFKRRIAIREYDGFDNLLGVWVWQPDWQEPRLAFITGLRLSLATVTMADTNLCEGFTWAHVMVLLVERANWRTVRRDGPFYTDLDPEELLAVSKIDDGRSDDWVNVVFVT